MSSTTCPKMTFFCGACRPVSAAYDEEVHLCPSSVCRGRCPHRPAGGRWRPPLRCRTFPLFGAPPKPGGGSELCRLRRRCHAAGWAHGRVAKRPFREKCRWASPSLFFRLHVLLAPLCAYPPRFLSRCGGCATPHCLPLREKHLAPAAQLLFRLRGALCGCSTGPRASCYISFAELIFTPGPMVEAHTQERMY